MAKELPERNIAMTFIWQVDRLILQHRTVDQKRGAVGLMGCFGGQINAGETAAQAALRELNEETNIRASLEDIHELGEVPPVESDRDFKPMLIKATAFEIWLPYGGRVMASKDEGSAVELEYPDGVLDAKHKGLMAPATSLAVDKFYGLGEDNG